MVKMNWDKVRIENKFVKINAEKKYNTKIRSSTNIKYEFCSEPQYRYLQLLIKNKKNLDIAKRYNFTFLNKNKLKKRTQLSKKIARLVIAEMTGKNKINL
uniref:Uncharacterized protein n=1 Tax=Spiroplasma citri TaxID=2133 RepID=Q14KA6_SPICI|nr:hypothetical protein SPICINP17_003 [Spiroplasma citri]